MDRLNAPAGVSPKSDELHYRTLARPRQPATMWTDKCVRTILDRRQFPVHLPPTSVEWSQAERTPCHIAGNLQYDTSNRDPSARRRNEQLRAGPGRHRCQERIDAHGSEER